MHPIIGITCGRYQLDGGWERCGQNMSYINAVALAGGAPLLIPLFTDEIALRAIYRMLDGLLLSGGVDIDPSRYGQTPHEKLGAVDALRDEVELTLTRWAVEEDKPVFAICRGIQVLNVALGGTLYQDIPSQIESALQHPYQPGKARDFLAHSVELVPHTLLADMLSLSENSVAVNSMHHQSLWDVAPGCIVTARAPDGVIEGIECPQHRFVVGVQWHPEEMVDGYPIMHGLFRSFVEAARVCFILTGK